MPVPLPKHYQTWLVRTLSSRVRFPTRELEGDTTSDSPEHMLLSSIGLCLLTTFEAFAVRDRIELVSWEARVSGMVDTTDLGLAFTRFQVDIDMEVGDVDRASETLEEAKQHCLITNALRAPVEVEARIRKFAQTLRRQDGTMH